MTSGLPDWPTRGSCAQRANNAIMHESGHHLDTDFDKFSAEWLEIAGSIG